MFYMLMYSEVNFGDPVHFIKAASNPVDRAQ